MDQKDQFLSVFIKNSSVLYHYILTLVPNYADADDLLQETASVMWSKFDSFHHDSNFLAWARQIARYNVSNYYRTKHERFQLDQETLDILSIEAEKSSDRLDDKKEALENCLKKLALPDQQLIHKRFYNNIPIRSIAASLNRPPVTVYKRIAFIYTVLQSCIHKTLAAWESR